MMGKGRGAESMSRKWTILLCIGCFCGGMLFSGRMWTVPEIKEEIPHSRTTADKKLEIISENCVPKSKDIKHETNDIHGKVSKTHQTLQYDQLGDFLYLHFPKSADISKWTKIQ
ncbi:hypothetical protein SAY87_021831 [Trapa incisa]|uniref:DUF4094 domain-containing protein n=1 Tax=Trapa incisa TaxID=236973 RepID=A0AAN7PST5_9MYRT|nr:hypothetical protein SAY87_021831 [Trapa incisa]